MTDIASTPLGPETGPKSGGETGTKDSKPALQHRKVKNYSRYERFWHWSQALLIFLLAFSGFTVHGTIRFIPFEKAVMMHDIAAFALIFLWLFTAFWTITTGQWRHFVPTNAGLWAVIRHYLIGMMVGQPHPYKRTLSRKQNPLQSAAYFAIMTLVGPLLWLSGLAYMFYSFWAGNSGNHEIFSLVVLLHLIGAFLMVAFVIGHIYMVTTGKTIFHYTRAMISGYEDMELTDAEVSYLETHEPDRIK